MLNESKIPLHLYRHYQLRKGVSLAYLSRSLINHVTHEIPPTTVIVCSVLQDSKTVYPSRTRTLFTAGTETGTVYIRISGDSIPNQRVVLIATKLY
jgi:uncharacterized protein (UPF0248 family)